MRRAYIVTGSLTDSRTIRLDEPVSHPGSMVRVIVEVDAGPEKMSHEEFLDWLHRRQDARGHVPLTPDEVAAHLRAEREGWDD